MSLKSPGMLSKPDSVKGNTRAQDGDCPAAGKSIKKSKIGSLKHLTPWTMTDTLYSSTRAFLYPPCAMSSSVLRTHNYLERSETL